MPAPSPSPPPQRQRGAARDVDGLIRELQRINLSQCMDQLSADISQLTTIEQQLTPAWSGLYVRCPDPEPGELGVEPADKKSSSGYSTESASPPGSSDVSGEAAGVGGESNGDRVVNDRIGDRSVNFYDARYASTNRRPVRFGKQNAVENHNGALNTTKTLPNGCSGFKSSAEWSSTGTVNVTSQLAGQNRVSAGKIRDESVSIKEQSEWRQRAIKRQESLGSIAASNQSAPVNGKSVWTQPGVAPLQTTTPASGLLQASVAHSVDQRQMTPLLARAVFAPPAASTPTLSPKQPRSPKTLRFAASHELIPPESPSRRQVAAGAPPRPGILRSRIGGAVAGGTDSGVEPNTTNTKLGSNSVNERTESLARPATPGWMSRSPNLSMTSSSGTRSRFTGSKPNSRSKSSASGKGSQTDSAERFSRVVSALSRLETELSTAQRHPPSRTYGTSQFVRHPPRRQLSFSHLPPPPIDPLVLVSTTTDSEESDSEGEWVCPDVTDTAARPPSDLLTDEGDFVLSSSTRRGARIPPRYSLSPPKSRRGHLSWLLSCGSRRRPPSPPSAYLSPPPSDDTPAPDTTMYGCNLCKSKFVEHSMLVAHVHERHMRVQMRPKYSCGLCPARFYASKFLARHCAYHHNSMGDKRTPQCLRSER